MTWTYLTRSYVEALQLVRVPVMSRRNVTASFISPNAVKPEAHDPWLDCVRFDGALYERELDGLAYRKLDT